MTSKLKGNEDKFDEVGKCDCGKPILRYMLKYSSFMCADCSIMWANEARFMQQ